MEYLAIYRGIGFSGENTEVKLSSEDELKEFVALLPNDEQLLEIKPLPMYLRFKDVKQEFIFANKENDLEMGKISRKT